MIGWRAFVSLLAGAIAACSVLWPLAAQAQQALPVIGFLNQESAEVIAQQLVGFRKGLSETGFVETSSVTIDYRWAEGHYERLPQLAAELVNRKVAVITAAYFPATLAAKAATSTIPIVFISGVDPIAAGLVAGLSRPGGNLTGISIQHESHGKAFGAAAPDRAARENDCRSGQCQKSGEPDHRGRIADCRRGVGHSCGFAARQHRRRIDAAFADAVHRRAGALLVAGDAYFNSRREKLIALAARYRLPVSYDRKEIATSGGLMSYGMNNVDFYRQAGIYTGQILKGAKPADLPVQQPTKVELVVNLKTARSLGLELPTSVLLSADEVIE
jgi:putative tryptophan/tyrosine transport system substrate-binding protein